MAFDLATGERSRRSWARGEVSGSFATDELVEQAKKRVPWKGVLIAACAVAGLSLLPTKKPREAT